MSRPWFSHKRFGYGAGPPITWEGWVTLAAFIIVLIVAARLGRSPAPERWFGIALGVVDVVIFVWIALLKTEGGVRWRWGDND